MSEDTYDDDGVATISRLLRIKGIFIEERLFYRALLQTRYMILRSLLIVATPYLCASSMRRWRTHVI